MERHFPLIFKKKAKEHVFALILTGKVSLQVSKSLLPDHPQFCKKLQDSESLQQNFVIRKVAKCQNLEFLYVPMEKCFIK